MAINPDQYYTAKDPELRVFGEPQTLAKWRSEGRGPAYIKMGSRVVYFGADLLAHRDANRVDTAA